VISGMGIETVVWGSVAFCSAPCAGPVVGLSTAAETAQGVTSAKRRAASLTCNMVFPQLARFSSFRYRGRNRAHNYSSSPASRPCPRREGRSEKLCLGNGSTCLARNNMGRASIPAVERDGMSKYDELQPLARGIFPQRTVQRGNVACAQFQRHCKMQRIPGTQALPVLLDHIRCLSECSTTNRNKT